MKAKAAGTYHFDCSNPLWVFLGLAGDFKLFPKKDLESLPRLFLEQVHLAPRICAARSKFSGFTQKTYPNLPEPAAEPLAAVTLIPASASFR